MTQHTAQAVSKPHAGIGVGSGIQIVDEGVPTARAMSELFARLPPSLRSEPSICLNPFDQSWLDQLDVCHVLSDTALDDLGASDDCV